MRKIKLLDEYTIQKIAAGEIIERPVSVVKELVENSLDANASTITIEISTGGKEYIRVTDDGEGFLIDDLKIAFKRHSTSKISVENDLYNITTFGFRGEALASISTISKVEVLTKTSHDISGTQVFVENGEIIKQNSIGCPKGTTMIIKDLFYNIPVRKKFLKSDRAEAGLIDDILYKLALGNENVSFKYIKDNKVIFNTSKNNDLIAKVYSLLGKDFYDNLININYKSKDFNVFGYISNNTFYRGNRKHQYLYVNNRYINNDEISGIIESKYKSLIPTNRFPVYIIFIDINPSLVDVNIHPTKQEVKFINQVDINKALDDLISKLLSKHLYVQKVTFKNEEDNINKNNNLPLLFEKSYLNEKDEKNVYKTFDYNDKKIKGIVDTKKDAQFIDKSTTNNYNYNNEGKENNKKNNTNKIFLENVRIIGVIFSTYILLENLKSGELLIMDQHSAHERVMYEKYKEEYENESVNTQTLLSPEVVEITNSEFELVMENLALLSKLGFIVEEFGQNSVIIRGVPILFGKPQVKGFFLEIVDSLKSNIKSSYDMKLDKIIKISCTNAVKSGDRMKNIEIKSLIEQLNKTKNPFTCPHGRPTVIAISKKDIEKEFKRII